MRFIVISLICFYQKYISPHKGFRCAHAYLHCGDSCSEAIKKIIEKHGVYNGYQLAKLRLNECKQAYIQVSTKNDNRKRKKRSRCDSCFDPASACDVVDCIPDGHCDTPDLPCDCSLHAHKNRWL
ncbi:membrane protein insertion efficiency factor YidD [uncultured Photobacterium sp.]|uniref:membrane protein insertion efficiency factor YidD n=1 Tax=uncultured Photobacterium sp. TaxID=173973 RepID=UPI00345D0791